MCMQNFLLVTDTTQPTSVPPTRLTWDARLWGALLVVCGVMLLGGRAADLLGRRRVFLIALAVFAVVSMLSSLATNPELLIAARFVKGVAAAFTAPAALSIITTTFHEGP